MRSTHGGRRSGAGRPKGESSKVLRVPTSKIDAVKEVIAGQSPVCIPLYTCHVRAGFPSPADDYIEEMLDLNQFLIKNPSSTFIVRVSGDSMIGIGIRPDSLLIVDRSIEPTHNKIVIAALDGELTVKRLVLSQERVELVAENPNYPPIQVTDDLDMIIWGVVTNMIQAFA